MHTDEHRYESPVPVVEYGREDDLDTRAGRVMWLLAGMLILSLVSMFEWVVQMGAMVVVSRLSVSSAMAGYLSAGVGLAVFVLSLIGSVLYASSPVRLNSNRLVWAGVVMCVLIVGMRVAGVLMQMAMARLMAVSAMGLAYQAQALFSLVQGVAFPIGVVVVMALLRRR